VLEIVIGDRHREPILGRIRRQPLRQRPGPQHPVLLEPEIEMMVRATVFVQDERGPIGHAVKHVESRLRPP